jgi:septum formation protein
VHPSGAAELERGDPHEVALQNALRKALAVRAARRDAAASTVSGAGTEAILGVDTLVTLGGVLYGKPADAASARATLSTLGGATHRVISGLALLLGEEQRTAVACTEVELRALGEELLDWYVGLGEWRERAGGYAIQGAGAALVRQVRGDYENVVGLPLATLLDLYPELL